VPPDVTACIFWLNRKPSEWRDVQQMEHILGKYMISDKPMTEALDTAIYCMGGRLGWPKRAFRPSARRFPL
jgi:hypothetical protein